MRTWLWQTRAERCTGILIWQVNHWQAGFLYGGGALRDPYLDPMSRHSHGKCFGNGDGMLFYPPKDRLADPVGSIRMEMLRDGIEDYDYFELLAARAPQSPLLAVPKEVTEELTRFSDSPLPIQRHRLFLARAIMDSVR